MFKRVRGCFFRDNAPWCKKAFPWHGFVVSRNCIRSMTSVLVSRSFNLPTIKINNAADTSAQMKQLEQRISLAPVFYKNAPVVIDAEDIKDTLTLHQIKKIYENLVNLELRPVGITNLSPALQKEAQDNGIPIITVPRGQSRTSQQECNEKNNNNSANNEVARNMNVTNLNQVLGERKEILSTVRSGQQIYARGPKAQLIILGNVSSGAEVLSDGDIHIHGSLFGRALAGVNGDEDARIYTKSMQAELIAIGGLYTSGDLLPDPVEASTLPCMAFVSDKKLSFAVASAF